MFIIWLDIMILLKSIIKSQNNNNNRISPLIFLCFVFRSSKVRQPLTNLHSWMEMTKEIAVCSNKNHHLLSHSCATNPSHTQNKINRTTILWQKCLLRHIIYGDTWLPPMELHLLLGVVNGLCDHLNDKLLGKNLLYFSKELVWATGIEKIRASWRTV